MVVKLLILVSWVVISHSFVGSYHLYSEILVTTTTRPHGIKTQVMIEIQNCKLGTENVRNVATTAHFRSVYTQQHRVSLFGWPIY